MTVGVTSAVHRSALARMSVRWASPTMSDSRAHQSTAIVIGKVVAQYLRHGVPLAGRKARQEAPSHLACRVSQLRRRAAELFELRERGVEISLVEYLAAVDAVTGDRQ